MWTGFEIEIRKKKEKKNLSISKFVLNNAWYLYREIYSFPSEWQAVKQ